MKRLSRAGETAIGEGDDRTGVQSIEVGMPLVLALARRGSATQLTSLAAAAGMTASKAHKYLISFIKVGLVRQDGANGLYDLGPTALELGLDALRRLDILQVAQATMQELCAQLDETVTLTVWSSRGPTTVRVVENLRPVAVTVKLGGVLPLLTSSNGRVFLAWTDRAHTVQLVENELADPSGAARRAGITEPDNVAGLIERTRAHGVAEVRGLVVPGIFGLSAPVWGPNGLVAALTVVGIVGGTAHEISAMPDALRTAAASLSRRVGGEIA